MPENASFVYDWWRPLSKYNTLRYEDANRARWQDMGIGRFIRNDRFFCEKKPDMVTITIRKTYTIPLAQSSGIFSSFCTKALGGAFAVATRRIFRLLAISTILA